MQGVLLLSRLDATSGVYSKALSVAEKLQTSAEANLLSNLVLL